MTARRSCVAVRVRKKEFDSGSVDLYFVFETHGQRSFKNSKNEGVGSCWQYRQLNRARIFLKRFKNISCIFVFFGKEFDPKSVILVQKTMFRIPKRIFLVAKQNQWPGAR